MTILEEMCGGSVDLDFLDRFMGAESVRASVELVNKATENTTNSETQAALALAGLETSKFSVPDYGFFDAAYRRIFNKTGVWGEKVLDYAKELMTADIDQHLTKLGQIEFDYQDTINENAGMPALTQREKDAFMIGFKTISRYKSLLEKTKKEILGYDPTADQKEIATAEDVEEETRADKDWRLFGEALDNMEQRLKGLEERTDDVYGPRQIGSRLIAAPGVTLPQPTKVDIRKEELGLNGEEQESVVLKYFGVWEGEGKKKEERKYLFIPKLEEILGMDEGTIENHLNTHKDKGLKRSLIENRNLVAAAYGNEAGLAIELDVVEGIGVPGFMEKWNQILPNLQFEVIEKENDYDLSAIPLPQKLGVLNYEDETYLSLNGMGKFLAGEETTEFEAEIIKSVLNDKIENNNYEKGDVLRVRWDDIKDDMYLVRISRYGLALSEEELEIFKEEAGESITTYINEHLETFECEDISIENAVVEVLDPKPVGDGEKPEQDEQKISKPKRTGKRKIVTKQRYLLNPDGLGKIVEEADGKEGTIEYIALQLGSPDNIFIYFPASSVDAVFLGKTYGEDEREMKHAIAQKYAKEKREKLPEGSVLEVSTKHFTGGNKRGKTFFIRSDITQHVLYGYVLEAFKGQGIEPEQVFETASQNYSREAISTDRINIDGLKKELKKYNLLPRNKRLIVN